MKIGRFTKIQVVSGAGSRSSQPIDYLVRRLADGAKLRNTDGEPLTIEWAGYLPAYKLAFKARGSRLAETEVWVNGTYYPLTVGVSEVIQGVELDKLHHSRRRVTFRTQWGDAPLEGISRGVFELFEVNVTGTINRIFILKEGVSK